MKRLLLALLLFVAVPAHAYIVTPSTILMDPTQDLVGAIESLPATGGDLQLGPGTYTISSTIRLDRPIRLRGAGMGATIIRMDTTLAAYNDSDMVRITSRYVSIEDLKLHGTGKSGLGRGVVIQSRIADAIWKISMRNVTVDSTSNSCLYFPNAGILSGRDSLDISTGANSVILSSFENCWFKENKSGDEVYIGWQHTTLTFKDCSFSRYINNGIRLEYAFGNNFIGGNVEEQLGNGATGVNIHNSANNRFENVWFENTTAFQSDWPFTLGGLSSGNVIRNCDFNYGSANVGVHNPRMIVVGGANGDFVTGTVIENCWAGVQPGTEWYDAGVNLHIIVGKNSRDTKIIGGGITDIYGVGVVGCSLSGTTLSLGTIGGVQVNSRSIELKIGDPIYPVPPNIQVGTYVSALKVGIDSTKVVLANFGGLSFRDSTGMTLGFNPGGNIRQFHVADSSQTYSTEISSHVRTRLPRVTTAQLALIDTPKPGDMVWVTDAASGHELQVYNGTAWSYVGHTP